MQDSSGNHIKVRSRASPQTIQYSFHATQNNGKIVAEPQSGETVSYQYDSLNHPAAALFCWSVPALLINGLRYTVDQGAFTSHGPGLLGLLAEAIVFVAVAPLLASGKRSVVRR
jgi:hypothetical protein